MSTKTVDVAGLIGYVPDELANRARELVSSGKAKFVGLCIKSGQIVSLEIEVPLNLIGEDIAKSLDKFSKGKL